MNHIPFLLATASAVFTPFCAAACPAFPDGRLSGHMAVPSSVKYEANTAAENEADTLRQYEIDEAVVVASPKETSSFSKQPVSVTLFSKAALQRIDAQSIKGMANFAPNFFMSNYGSRLSSAVYIRGIGSRINTPAVGLYVDNIPYVDKSAYDFSFLDVTRVDVLRGPQGTLYGRNSMGGLVRIFTADPFTHEGTDVKLSGASRTAARSVKAVSYFHPSAATALSLGGFYEGENGFFRNHTTGRKADGSSAGGGKVRFGWKPSDVLRVDLTANYEYSDEDACPYFLTKANGQTAQPAQEGLISQNRQSNYRRELASAGLGLEWQAPRFILSSVSSWQHLRDRLFMDQDFVEADVFSLTQKQRYNTLTEELSLKSHPGKRWQWTTGAFMMYQDMHTSCPVTFYSDGVSYLNRQFQMVLPSSPAMSLAFTSSSLPFTASFQTPTLNAALFHQSTVDLGSGLSLIAGLRLDYDHTRLKMDSRADGRMDYRFSMPAFHINADLSASPDLSGELENDTWQVLPKLALQYNHRSGRGNVYVAVSKGYRSGGYNIQSYSDLSQTQLQRNMMLGIKDFSIATINALPLPEKQKQRAIQGMTGILDAKTPKEPSLATLAYKPEQTWNYELGGHLTLVPQHLQMFYTFFYMHTKDQQLARFAESGMGRVMVNAGRSRSCGAELTLRASLLNDRLNLSGSYGYTNAEFSAYDLGQHNGTTVDYTGNKVPFAPAHTLGATAEFRQPLSNSLCRALTLGADVQGAGRIWWDEANTFSQPFYAVAGARIGAEFAGNVNLTLWTKNVTATRYDVFSFQSMNNQFAQIGQPRCFGIDVSVHF